MPYVTSECLAKDNIQVWYRTNLENDNIANLDHSKPTVILLHGILLSSSFLDPQFNDVRLSNAFNLIAFDSLSSGKTKNPVNPRHDLWCDAALLAICLEALNLPPCHIMANNAISVPTALSFAILFNEKCLSLMLVGIPGEKELDWCSKAYIDLIQMWSSAPDIETLEEVSLEVAYLLFSNVAISRDLMDDIVAYWMQQWPPNRRSYLLDVSALLDTRVPHSQDEYDLVTQPVLLVTGDSSIVHPVEMAEDLQTKLRKARGGCKLQVVKGGPESLHVPQPCANIINRYLHQFVTSYAPTDLPSSALATPPIGLEAVMRSALELLTDLEGGATFKGRDPLSIWSFSRMTFEVEQYMVQHIATFKHGEEAAFNPLDKDGNPLRKFSKRHHDQILGPPKYGRPEFSSATIVVETSHTKLCKVKRLQRWEDTLNPVAIERMTLKARDGTADPLTVSRSSDVKTEYCPSPFSNLPNELVSTIFAFLIYSITDPLQRYRFPATLSKVCRRWAKNVLSTPELWSFIYIVDRMSLSTVDSRIQSSRSLPLEVTICYKHGEPFPPPELNDHSLIQVFSEKLLPLSDRWLTLTLVTGWVDRFVKLLPTSFPLLTSIEISDLWDKDFKERLFFAAPLLRTARVHYMGHRLRWNPTNLTLSNLSAFYLDGAYWMPLGPILDHITNCPNLTVMELHHIYVDFPETQGEVLQLSSRKPIRLSQLKSMTLELSGAWGMSVLLALLDAAELHTLTISLGHDDAHEDWTDFLEQFPWNRIKPNFPLLQSLTLKDWFMLLEQGVPVLQQLPPVRNLSIIWTPANMGDAVDERAVMKRLGDPRLRELTALVDLTSEAWVMVEGWTWHGSSDGQRVPFDFEGLHFFDD